MSKPRALIVFVLFCFPLTLNAFAQTPISTSETRSKGSTTKEKGLALLSEIEGLIPQLRSPEGRLRAQLAAAEIVLECDEKRAAKLLADVTAGYKLMLASLSPDDPEYVDQYSTFSGLRDEIVRLVATHDTEAALSFLYSTTLPPDPYSNRFHPPSPETALELSIALRAVPKNPKRALELARKALKTSFPSELYEILSQLEKQNRELARELANEIAGKLIDQKLFEDSEAAHLAMILIRTENEENGENTSAGRTLFSEERYRNLLDKMLNEALTYSRSSDGYDPQQGMALSFLRALKSLGADLEKSIAGATMKVDKKLAELEDWVSVGRSSASSDLILEPSVNQSYMQVAFKYVDGGDMNRARQVIDDRATSINLRFQQLAQLEKHEIAESIKQGRFEDALKRISRLRNGDRAQQLIEIADKLAEQNPSRAISLLEHALSILGHSPHAPNEGHLVALLAIADAFARHDSKRSFEIVEPLIDQLNEMCAAARTLEGFGSDGYYSGEELDLHADNPVASITEKIGEVLGQLALLDFDRSKSASDRVRLPEVRLKMFLIIAQHAIEDED